MYKRQIYSLVKDYPVDDLAIALDTSHTTIEGGLSWPIHYNLVRPHLGALYVKDFAWKGGTVDWRPLGEGYLPAQPFDQVIRGGFAGPISQHGEYLDRSRPDSVKRHIAAIRSDLKTLRSWLAKSTNNSSEG